MAEKRRFLDVWIVDSNTVYREVPFTVVIDWVQQGRLLENDNLRWSGTANWFQLGTTPAFAAYLPRSEPFRADDQAEALEPVQVDFAWKKRPDDEDDDVDMIPLIDISLVLLIFFIMTTTGVVASTAINTPKAEFSLVTPDPELIWIGINPGADDKPVYSLGIGEKAPAEGDDNLKSQEDLLVRLDTRLAELQPGNTVNVNVKADENLKSGVVRKLMIELEKRRARVRAKYTGVSEKGP